MTIMMVVMMFNGNNKNYDDTDCGDDSNTKHGHDDDAYKDNDDDNEKNDKNDNRDTF